MITGCDKTNNEMPVAEGDFSNVLSDEEINGKRLTPEILWKFGRVDDMSLSPMGRRLFIQSGDMMQRPTKAMPGSFL